MEKLRLVVMGVHSTTLYSSQVYNLAPGIHSGAYCDIWSRTNHSCVEVLYISKQAKIVCELPHH